MATYEATDPDTGMTIELTGDKPPSGADIKAAFAKVRASKAPTQPNQPEPQSVGDMLSNLPKTVLDDIKSGNPAAMVAPGVAPIALAALRDHPELAKIAGAAAGTGVGALTGGPFGLVPGMMIGGAAGASLADSGSQLAQMGSSDAPKTAGEALGRSGMAGLEGGASGLIAAGGVPQAPAVLRAIASKNALAPTVVGGLELYKTGDPGRALKAAAITAVGGVLAKKGATALEGLIAQAKAAHAEQQIAQALPSNVVPIRPAAATAAPAAQAASAAPAVSQPSATLPNPQQLQAQIVQWRQKLGYSPGQMAQSLNELYKIPKTAGKQMIDMVMKAYGLE